MAAPKKIRKTLPETALEVEAKRFMRNPKGSPPRALVPIIQRLKKQQKQAAEEAAKKVLALPDGRQPDYEKLEKFLEAYLTNGNNTTQAALTVDPTSSLVKASQQGREYFALAKKYITQIQLEKNGWGHGKFMEVLMKNMETSRKTDWWDRGMKLAGYDDFISPQKGQAPQTINIIGAQKQDMDTFGFAEEGEVVDEN